MSISFLAPSWKLLLYWLILNSVLVGGLNSCRSIHNSRNSTQSKHTTEEFRRIRANPFALEDHRACLAKGDQVGRLSYRRCRAAMIQGRDQAIMGIALNLGLF